MVVRISRPVSNPKARYKRFWTTMKSPCGLKTPSVVRPGIFAMPRGRLSMSVMKLRCCLGGMMLRWKMAMRLVGMSNGGVAEM